MNLPFIPELLSPAGDSERLHAAVEYGADAVYLGGSAFGMRAAPQNFSGENLREAVRYAHDNNVKVYLTCNVLPRNDELLKLPGFLEEWADCGVDALIVTDIGVLSMAKQYASNVDIHISTQAGIVNYAAANQFYDMGASRIVTARELSMEEIAEIRAKTNPKLEIECFVHGAMCVSFSGRCLLSNYLVGRDSNRGACAQPCRWKYHIVEESRPGEYFPVGEDNEGTYIMNARDMCMIEHIPDLVNAGISSFKIEGRAKSAYYTAVVTNAYRAAIDGYLKNPSDDYKPEKWIVDELYKMSYREYCTGFYYGDPKDNAQIYYDGGYKREWDVVALSEHSEGDLVFCGQRNRFFLGDELEVMEAGKAPYRVKVLELYDEKGEPIEAANRATMKFSMKCGREIPAGAIIRKEKKD